MLPMEFFANRGFAVTNAVSIAMYFGMFGSIFFLSQFLQNVLHNTPLQAGVKLLVWTGAVMVVSPAAGFLSERYGSRLFMVAGLGLQAVALGLLATLASVHQSYASMVIPFVLAGSGMALVFAPSANAVLSSVRTAQTGQASGATNAIRELGGVLGIAVLATVFTSHGSYATPHAVRERPGAGHVGRGGRARRGRADRPRAPVQHPRLGGAPRRGRGGPRRRPLNRAPRLSCPRIVSSPMATTSAKTPRQRVPASERRDALIDAAIHEFAHGGLHGTPVDKIARRVGVAQPYVFSLFGSKRDLFLAAVERNFEVVADTFTKAAAEFDPATAPPDMTVLNAMGTAYVELLGSESHRDYLMLQLQSYAACDDETIRDRVRTAYARLISHVERLSQAEPEEIDEFFRYGMWLNVAAAMGVEDLSVGCEWVQAEQAEQAEAEQAEAEQAEAE